MTPSRLFSIAMVGLLLHWSRAEASGAEPSASKRNALWIQPLGTIIYGATGTSYVPLGAHMALSDSISLGVEMAWLSPPLPMFLLPNFLHSPDKNLRQFIAGVGPIFHLRQGTQRSGFFIQPKLLGIHTTQVSGETRSLELQAAVSIGYQQAIGSFFIGTSVGAGVGYRFLDQSEPPISLFGYTLAPTGSGLWNLAASLDLNLLKVGLAF
jgi:hypothetical protein